MKRLLLLAALAALAALLSGCALFGGDQEQKPAKLVSITPELDIDRLWSVKLGKGADIPLRGLRPTTTIVADRVFAAAADGSVYALERDSGREIWSTDLDRRLSAGPGVGSDLVVLGGLDGEVIALDAATGAELWRAETSSEVLSPPAAADGMVVVRSQDGRVYGFRAADGYRSWVYDQSVPLLSLRGTGEPLLLGGFAYLGFDNGRVAALRIADGTLVWEQTVAAPQGRTELERIVDIDGPMLVVASDLFAVSYQGLVGALTASSGRMLWVKDMSSATGVDISRTQLAVADADDAVWLLDRLTGGTLWKQDALARRGLSGAVFHAGAVVVGDAQGYLHWMSLEDGRFVARERVGKDPVRTRPVVVADLLLVQTGDGRLHAYRQDR